jgi:hypothetical protein
MLLGQVFLQILQFLPAHIIPQWLSIFMYHMGDEQWARWWPQFRDVVSPHRHKQQLSQNGIKVAYVFRVFNINESTAIRTTNVHIRKYVMEVAAINKL